MTILSFFSYHNNHLSIPNKELMQNLKSNAMGSLANIVKSSQEMLKATLNEDCEKMANLIYEAHATYLTFFNYNDENSLTCLINLIYLSPRTRYNISREDVAGLGLYLLPTKSF